LFCERNNKFCQKNKNMSYNSSQLWKNPPNFSKEKKEQKDP
jgi:hypothetical protein